MREVVDPLPLLDEHRTRLDAPADAAWNALVSFLRGRIGGSGAFARLLGCDPVAASPSFTGAVDQTLPGFRVVESEPGHLLALRGRHRFARYALTFLIEDGELRARSEAAFPGIRGWLYRGLLMWTGGHRLVTRGMIRRVARDARRAPA